MLLAFDTGNTNTVMGLYDQDELLAHWRFATDSRRTADEYGLLCNNLFSYHHLKDLRIDRMIISSVVPDLTGTLVEMGRKYFHLEPMTVGAGMKTGLKIRYENPREVGADRIVNAVAAIAKYGAPIIVVDFGTATTFCAINKDEEYLGGAITAGVGISMEALFKNAAKLPKIDLVAPEKIIGRNTVAAMQSGLIYGYAGLIDTMVEKMAHEMGYYANTIQVVATGGRSDIICPHCRYVDEIDMGLTLSGLRLLAEKN